MIRSLAFAALLMTAPSAAQSDEEPPETTLTTRHDAGFRLTVPVTIDGKGPFDFVVDTGADRTVVSRQIADRLNLAQGEAATLHTMTGVSRITTVRVPALGVGGRASTDDIHAPALEQEHLGAEGLLGVDSLKGRRIVMDFRKRQMSVHLSSERERVEPDTIVVTARSRYGQLVLVDADVDGTPVTVIVDSGAQNTIGNGALRRLLAKRNRKLQFFKTELVDVTGGRLPAEVSAIGRVRIGGILVSDVIVAFADAHPFQRFELDKRPAMLLGMDTLRGFRRVSVDFGQKKVRFLPPGAGRDELGTQLAATKAFSLGVTRP